MCTSSEADQPNPASTVTANKLQACIIVYFEVRSISGKGKHWLCLGDRGTIHQWCLDVLWWGLFTSVGGDSIHWGGALFTSE